MPYAIGYAIFAAAVVFVAHLAAAPLAWPESVVRAVDFAAVLGLPLTILFAWLAGRSAAKKPPEAAEAAPAAAEALPTAAEPSEPEPAVEEVPSLAVLPFTDQTDSPEGAAFADGFSEELREAFAADETLRVASRTACLAFRGKHADTETAARQLGVRHLVDGAIRQEDEHLYVEARLREAGGSEPLWAETWERSIVALFDIQDDIVSHVAGVIGLTLAPASRDRATTADAVAYGSFLCGRGCFIRGKLTDMAHAVRLFSEATEKDPQFVRAWIDLAETYAMQAIYYEGSDAERKAADEASARAVELAPGDGKAHAARGLAHLASESYDEASREFELAIERDPTLWEAYYNYGRASYHQGRMAQALKLFEQAAAANPCDFQSPLLASPIYRAMGDESSFEKAAREGVARAERHLADSPENHRAYYLGAGALLDLGERERAFAWAEKALAIDPSDPSIRYNMGCFYAKAGEIDKAFDCLKNSITSRSWFQNDPDLEPIREDPRYQRLLDSLD